MKQGWKRIRGMFKKTQVEPQANQKPSIVSLVEELKRQQAEQEASGVVAEGSEATENQGKKTFLVFLY